VPGFRILDHLVTVAEFDAFLSETKYQPASQRRQRESGELAAPDDPVWVDYDSALAFARWVGGHIPSRDELALAQLSGELVLPEPTTWASGEYLLDLCSPDSPNPAWLPYKASAGMHMIHIAFRGTTPVTRLDSNETEGIAPGFRIAFADDEPGVYRRLEADPFADVTADSPPAK
jgi:hypothetical protein